LVNSKPYWTVNRWPPREPETTVQEERVWAPSTDQKIVSSEDKGKKEEQNSRKFAKPHIETIDDEFLKPSGKKSDQESIDHTITVIGSKSAVRIVK
jgi:hypothetical protein